MIPTSSEIEYFVEIYKTRHVSKAAIRLGVTQPTLTLSLQKLEEKLGSRLFHRTKQGVVPTDQGALFFRKANELMESWESIQRGVESSASEIQGHFKVGCHPCVGAYALPGFMERMYREAPGIELELIHDISRKITEGIISFSIDIGFVVNPVRHPDLVLRKLGDDRVLFWKARQTSEVPKRIFADVGLTQVESILGKSRARDFADWKLISTGSLELIRTLTLGGQGIGILPERVAKADGADLVPYDPKLPIFDDKIFLAYRKDAISSRAGRELVRLASSLL